MDTCSGCKREISSGRLGSIGGVVAHKRCPPFVRETFQDVLFNCDDQVLVRTLLKNMVPESTQREIVAAFNDQMLARHERKINQD